MNWFKKKPKEDWRLVYTLEGQIQWTDMGNRIDTIYYYLYESNLGRRRVEIKETGYAEDHAKGSSHAVYCKTAYPWSKGKNFSDIPTYWDMVDIEDELYVEELYKRLLTPSNPNINFK